MKTNGRPPHEPTAITKRKVETCAAGGMSQEDIAIMLRIDAKTLAKHYEEELSVGSREAKAEILEALRKQAKKGNVSAARLLLTGLQRPEPLREPTDASLEIISMPSQATGVKAQRNEDAKVAQKGTEWATLLPSSVQ